MTYCPDMIEISFAKVCYVGSNVRLLVKVSPSILTLFDTEVAVCGRSVLE